MLRLAAPWALCTGAAQAIPPDIRLDQLYHQRWTATDGAPPAARAAAQTTDGALWLGSDKGLFRFDGVAFQRINAPASQARPIGLVSALLATADGGLWIGLRTGGVYFWQAGRFTAHGDAEGLPAERTIQVLLRDRAGSVWAATTSGVFRLEGRRWLRQDTALGLPNSAQQMLFDRRGVLWLTSPGGVYRLGPGQTQATKVTDTDGFGYLVEAPDGAIWHAERRSTGKADFLQLADAAGQAPASTVGLLFTEQHTHGRPLIDRDGGLWYGDQDGVVRLPGAAALTTRIGPALPAQAQVFTPAQGLSGHSLYLAFQDGDGNVWISTDDGLDRFRVPRILPRTEPHLSIGSVAVGPHGRPMFCTPSGIKTLDGRDPLLSPPQSRLNCQATDTDPAGRHWYADTGGLWLAEGGRGQAIAWPDEARPVLGVPAIKGDASGALWVSLVRQNLFRYRDGTWTRVPAGEGGFPPSRPVVMSRDRQGQLWFGYPENRVLKLVADRPPLSWGGAQGLRVGIVQAITDLGSVVLVGGGEGLGALVDGRVVMLRGESERLFEGISAVFADAAGDVWLHANSGLLRLPRDELGRALKDPRHGVRVERFDTGDGIRGQNRSLWPLPTAAAMPDGSIWLTTGSGVYAFDPARLARNARPPVVEVRALRAEGRDTPLDEAPQPQVLPVGTRRIDLAYAAIHIARPERVRYRYRLDGVDADWQHTTARSATYTNLGPGDYVFRVSAANEDGVWNEAGATLNFRVPPAFHQTTWFHVLCALGVALLAWGAHRLRIRQLTTRIRLRTEAQAQERERIARNLHDTLLQSVQGLVLGVQSLADRTPADHPERPRIERMLARADQAVREGRRKVLELRSGDDGADPADAAEWLSDLAGELSERGPAAVSVRCLGAPRALQPAVHEQVLHIGHEAMVNAQQHARATRIELLLDHGADGFRLEVSDDGVGMRDALMDGSESVPGHWGLAGMRERAAMLGATLAIERPAEGGTRVRLAVPAALAYAVN